MKSVSSCCLLAGLCCLCGPILSAKLIFGGIILLRLEFTFSWVLEFFLKQVSNSNALKLSTGSVGSPATVVPLGRNRLI